MSKKVAVIMGSDSDLDTMRPCIQRLKSFGIPTEVHIISAHRTPAAAERFASQAREERLRCDYRRSGQSRPSGRCAGRLYHPARHRRAHQDLYDGRAGLPSVHGADAQGNSRGLRGGGRRGQRPHSGRPDAGPFRRGPERPAGAVQGLAWPPRWKQRIIKSKWRSFNMSYEKLEQLYEGKAKKIFAPATPNV